MVRLFLLIVLFSSCKNLISQNTFYNVDTIRNIKIYFNESNWDEILDSLYIADNNDRMLATVLIDGIQYDSIGIRYKGFSSVSVNRVKNPFNIKLDYIIEGQNHEGIDKLKLSNVIQDPSFIREVLTYEIARKYMPASESNYANVYINDTLWGLYTNVEAVNKDFLSKHYASRNNSFFKGNPQNLNLNGENSNLSTSPGTDSTDYYPYYNIESDYGWKELYHFIDTLNNYPDSIENILNVDRTLWMHALNYTMVNFDSYIGYAQNYYLYKDNNGRFNPILWDLNMSFASFRLADASLFYNGFNIQEAKTMDPLAHYNSISVYQRPLLRNLFNNDQYRRMYMAHIRTIVEENFSNQDYHLRGLYLQNLIDIDVANDTNKFYTYSDFQNNLTSTVSDLIDYPGITDLMDNRANYLSSYSGFSGAPTISNINNSPQSSVMGDDVWITAKITDGDNVILAYRPGSAELFHKITMLDDGNQNDGIAGDSIFGAKINNIGNLLQYYIYAENDSSGRFSPERAAYEFYSIQSMIDPNDLVINEVMASNNTTATDQSNEYDDWIELYNTTSNNISTGGLFLSDDLNNLTKWPLPDVVISSDDYLIIWADEDSKQSGLHANFKLSSSGESVLLSYTDSTIIDSITYPYQSIDVSYARLPNGTGPFIYMIPSFNANNNLAMISEIKDYEEFTCYPNPVNNQLHLIFNNDSPLKVEIIDINGKKLFENYINPYNRSTQINTSNLSNGLYFIRIINQNNSFTKKFIKN